MVFCRWRVCVVNVVLCDSVCHAPNTGSCGCKLFRRVRFWSFCMRLRLCCYLKQVESDGAWRSGWIFLFLNSEERLCMWLSHIVWKPHIKCKNLCILACFLIFWVGTELALLYLLFFDNYGFNELHHRKAVESGYALSKAESVRGCKNVKPANLRLVASPRDFTYPLKRSSHFAPGFLTRGLFFAC